MNANLDVKEVIRTLQFEPLKQNEVPIDRRSCSCCLLIRTFFLAIWLLMDIWQPIDSENCDCQFQQSSKNWLFLAVFSFQCFDSRKNRHYFLRIQSFKQKIELLPAILMKKVLYFKLGDCVREKSQGFSFSGLNYL